MFYVLLLLCAYAKKYIKHTTNYHNWCNIKNSITKVTLCQYCDNHMMFIPVFNFHTNPNYSALIVSLIYQQGNWG